MSVTVRSTGDLTRLQVLRDMDRAGWGGGGRPGHAERAAATAGDWGHEVTTIGDSMQGLLDRQAVVDLAVRYATALDTKDWTLLATCFVPDAVAIYSTRGRVEGYAGIEDVCRGALGPLTASQHLLGNHVVELDGDDGRACCYFQAQHVLTGTEGGDTYTVAGTYRDRVVRTPEGWRRQRQLTVLWTQGNERVLHPARS